MNVVEQIERLAQSGAEMPTGLAQPDQLLYLSLRNLYHSYKTGIVDKQQATKEKRQIITQYEIAKLKYEAHEDSLNAIYEMSPFASDAQKSGCPYCKSLLGVFDGRIHKYNPQQFADEK